MHAHSEGPGKGSIFLFTIRGKPAKVAARRTAQVGKGMQQALQGKRVLIVDDNATNRRILTLQTAKWGMTARDAEHPRTALQWLKEGEHFDLIITDMHMPELDGLMFTRAVRELQDRQASHQKMPSPRNLPLRGSRTAQAAFKTVLMRVPAYQN